jgi:hypothetical protein
MQIKSIVAAAVAAACMLTSMAGSAAMSEDKVNATTEKDPEARSSGEPMTVEPMAQTSKSALQTIRNTRPKADRHRDARACLEAGKNEAIIRCANKYR